MDRAYIIFSVNFVEQIQINSDSSNCSPLLTNKNPLVHEK